MPGVDVSIPDLVSGRCAFSAYLNTLSILPKDNGDYSYQPHPLTSYTMFPVGPHLNTVLFVRRDLLPKIKSLLDKNPENPLNLLRRLIFSESVAAFLLHKKDSDRDFTFYFNYSYPTHMNSRLCLMFSTFQKLNQEPALFKKIQNLAIVASSNRFYIRSGEVSIKEVDLLVTWQALALQDIYKLMNTKKPITDMPLDSKGQFLLTSLRNTVTSETWKHSSAFYSVAKISGEQLYQDTTDTSTRNRRPNRKRYSAISPERIREEKEKNSCQRLS